MKPKMLSLTDQQLGMVKLAAETIAPSARSEFLERVAAHLGELPTNEAVEQAINVQLSIGKLPVFLCDSKTKSHDEESFSHDGKKKSHDVTSFSHSAREHAEQHFKNGVAK